MIAKALLMFSFSATVTLAYLVSASKKDVVDPNTLKCDPIGQTHLLLPYFEDCKKFFRCVNGEKVLFSCPEGTVFDRIFQVCSHEATTECNHSYGLKPSEGHEESAEEDDLGEAYGWDKDENSILSDEESEADDPLNCAEITSREKRKVFRGDCSRYWYCSSEGEAKTAYCSDGLYFNPRREQCDFEVNVKCPYDITHSELNNEFIKT